MGKTIEEIKEEIKKCNSLEKLEIIIKEVDALPDGFEKESLKLKIDDKREQIKTVAKSEDSFKIPKKIVMRVGTVIVAGSVVLGVLAAGYHLGKADSANNIIANKIPTTIEQSIEVESEMPTESFEESSSISAESSSVSVPTPYVSSAPLAPDNSVSAESNTDSTSYATSVPRVVPSDTDPKDYFLQDYFSQYSNKIWDQCWKDYNSLSEEDKVDYRFLYELKKAYPDDPILSVVLDRAVKAATSYLTGDYVSEEENLNFTTAAAKIRSDMKQYKGEKKIYVPTTQEELNQEFPTKTR